MATPAPARIDRYQVIRRLGRGGMGEVYLASDPALGRTVAIKILTDDNDELRERFAREARSAAALNHPNIVIVYDVGEYEHRPFIAMEYLDGETMAEMIRRRVDPSVRRTLDLMIELCAGLGHAHRSGIVHRDIKPANLMITADGTLKILDFGIARVKEDATSSGLTRLGMVIGSTHYMSPEQAEGLPVDDRSDIFSVGSVFYELLTGERAFPGDNPQVVINKVLTREPRPISEVRPDVDPELERIVKKALTKDLPARYSSLSALAADIGRVRDRLHEDEQATIRLPRSAPRSGSPPAATPAPVFRGAPDSKEIARRRAAQIEALLEEASDHFEAGEYELAIEDGEKALVIEPTESRALRVLQKAHRALEERQIRVWLEEARSLQADGALTGAERLVAQSLQLQPDSPEAQAAMASLTEHRLERERARARERSTRAAVAKGQSYLEAGGLEAALRLANDALALAADDEEAQRLKRAVDAAIRARDELDRRAAEAVTAAWRHASTDDTNGAISLLQGFRPSHPDVTQALIEIEHARAERAARREAERAERDRLERERIEQQRLADERAAQEQLDRERRAREREIERRLRDDRHSTQRSDVEPTRLRDHGTGAAATRPSAVVEPPAGHVAPKAQAHQLPTTTSVWTQVRTRKGAVAAAVVTVLVVSLAAGILWILRPNVQGPGPGVSTGNGNTGEGPGGAVQKVETVAVAFDLQPWAEVQIVDGKGQQRSVQTTPFVVQLPPGEYTFNYDNRFTKKPESVSVRVEANVPQTINRVMAGFDIEQAVKALIGPPR